MVWVWKTKLLLFSLRYAPLWSLLSLATSSSLDIQQWHKKLFPARSFWTSNIAKAMTSEGRTVQILTLLKAVFILDRDTIVDGVLKKYTV